MMGSMGDLVVNFVGNTAPFQRSVGMMRGALGRFKSFAGSVLRGIGGFFTSFVGVFSVGAVVAGLTKAVNAAREADQSLRKLKAVLTSTGGAAGYTASELSDFASEWQRTTNFEGDATVDAMAMLATFTQIQGQTFRDAIVSAQDLSAVTGQDLQASVVQLGKALNDPIRGVTALRKVGVSFTDAQQEQIRSLQESGDLMGAQRVILAELSKEFGGAAKAMRDPMVVLKNTLGDVMEAIGGGLLPYLGMIGDTLATSIGGATPQVSGLGTAFGGIADTIQTVIVAWTRFQEYFLYGIAEVARITAIWLSGFDKAFTKLAQKFSRVPILSRMFGGAAVFSSGAEDFFTNLQSEAITRGNAFRQRADAIGKTPWSAQAAERMRQAEAERAKFAAMAAPQIAEEIDKWGKSKLGASGTLMANVIERPKAETAPSMQYAGLAIKGSAEAYMAVLAAQGSSIEKKAAQAQANLLPKIAKSLDSLDKKTVKEEGRDL